MSNERNKMANDVFFGLEPARKTEDSLEKNVKDVKPAKAPKPTKIFGRVYDLPKKDRKYASIQGITEKFEVVPVGKNVLLNTDKVKRARSISVDPRVVGFLSEEAAWAIKLLTQEDNETSKYIFDHGSSERQKLTEGSRNPEPSTGRYRRRDTIKVYREVPAAANYVRKKLIKRGDLETVLGFAKKLAATFSYSVPLLLSTHLRKMTARQLKKMTEHDPRIGDFFTGLYTSGGAFNPATRVSRTIFQERTGDNKSTRRIQNLNDSVERLYKSFSREDPTTLSGPADEQLEYLQTDFARKVFEAYTLTSFILQSKKHLVPQDKTLIGGVKFVNNMAYALATFLGQGKELENTFCAAESMKSGNDYQFKHVKPLDL